MKDPTITEIMKLKHETEHTIAQAIIRFHTETNLFLKVSPEIEFEHNIADNDFKVKVELVIPNPFKEWYLTWQHTASSKTQHGQ